MKRLSRKEQFEFNSESERRPLYHDDAPPAPEGYHWDKDYSGWRHLFASSDTSSDVPQLWAVRNREGQICIGVINKIGFVLDENDMDTAVITLLAHCRLDIGERVTMKLLNREEQCSLTGHRQRRRKDIIGRTSGKVRTYLTGSISKMKLAAL